MTWVPTNMPVEVYTPLTIGQVLLYFVLVPLLFVLVVVVLVSAPSWTRSGRHRPGQGWSSDPLLIGAGAEAAPALTAEEGSPAQDDADTGGSSGRW